MSGRSAFSPQAAIRGRSSTRLRAGPAALLPALLEGPIPAIKLPKVSGPLQLQMGFAGSLPTSAVKPWIARFIATTFHREQHPDLRADFILAILPFNISDWGGDRLAENRRWAYCAPPTSNANYAWLQHTPCSVDSQQAREYDPADLLRPTTSRPALPCSFGCQASRMGCDLREGGVMNDAWKGRIEWLTGAKAEKDAFAAPWVRFAAESVDDWISTNLEGFVPAANFTEIRDPFRTDQRVSALFERAMARRNDLLVLQSQAYTRALQYRASWEMRKHVRAGLAASNNQEVSSILARGMGASRDAFDGISHELAKGFAEQSGSLAESNELLSKQQGAASSASLSLLEIAEKLEDDMQLLHDLERGPFDYEGRFLRMRQLYLNDFKLLVSCAINYRSALSYLNDTAVPAPNLPDFRSPLYIWEIGPILQVASSSLYAYRSRLIYRTLKLFVSPQWGENPLPQLLAADCFIETIPDGTPMTDTQWFDLMITQGKYGFGFTIPEDYFSSRGLLNARLEAFGVQWFDRFNTPGDVSSERNVRIDCDVIPPQARGIEGHPRAIVHFPYSITTYLPTEDVVIEDGSEIRGLEPVGRWYVNLGLATRRGGPALRIANNRDLNSVVDPCISGVILHLRVSAVLPPPLPPLPPRPPLRQLRPPPLQ